MDGGEVRVAGVQRRRADRDEQRPRVLERVGQLRREMQAAPVLDDEIVQPGLPDGDDAALEVLDLALVDVDAPDLVAQLGEAGRGDQADVAGSDHADGFALSHESAQGYYEPIRLSERAIPSICLLLRLSERVLETQ